MTESILSYRCLSTPEIHLSIIACATIGWSCGTCKHADTPQYHEFHQHAIDYTILNETLHMGHVSRDVRSTALR